MQHLEPTYLRYIYDGLVKGSIHSEILAEFQNRLIGLKDEKVKEITLEMSRNK